MREIYVGINDDNQRLDRFLKKYLKEAPLSFIYKNLRKKNIKVNDKKATPETTIKKDDKITLYLSEETIEKFLGEAKNFKKEDIPDIIYEDKNILLINKPSGILSHSAQGEYEKNIVDMMISYLINKGEYVPRLEKSFTPSLCNRLDRNTSGILIGAKNSNTLRSINKAIRDKKISKYYLTIVKGELKDNIFKKSYLNKNEAKNIVSISSKNNLDSKEIETEFKPLYSEKGYTLLEVNLITGRTHQIRAQLQEMGFPIIGDRKYGNSSVNLSFRNSTGLNNQLLHSYRLKFNGLLDDLKYLNGKVFTLNPEGIFKKVELEIWGDDFE